MRVSVEAVTLVNNVEVHRFAADAEAETISSALSAVHGQCNRFMTEKCAEEQGQREEPTTGHKRVHEEASSDDVEEDEETLKSEVSSSA